MNESWEDEDWESIDVPDLRNKEEEEKKLLERKLVEEADVKLTNELFQNEEKNKKNPEVIKEKEIEIVGIKNNKKCLPKLNSKKIGKSKKQIEEEKQREIEMFGESLLDEYEEKYGYLQEYY
jgi:hypothetical protein